MSTRDTQIVNPDAVAFHLGRREKVRNLTNARGRLEWVERQLSELDLAQYLVRALVEDLRAQQFELEDEAREASRALDNIEFTPEGGDAEPSEPSEHEAGQ